jgi:succinate dehydrogenase / fumarate reductase cytochrome b subunit
MILMIPLAMRARPASRARHAASTGSDTTADSENGLTAMRLSSILKKVVMAVTGLGWFLYVILHLAGNLLLFVGPETYNSYAQALVSNPLIYPAEIGLVVLLVLHLGSAWRVTRENNQARPQSYAYKLPSTGSSTFASRTMWYGGVILLLFIIIHVWTFKFGDHAGVHGLWGLVVRSFKNPWITLGYVVALLALGLHLSHGFGSALQSLGMVPPRWRTGLKKTGQVLGWVLAGGFILLPLWALFFAKV